MKSSTVYLRYSEISSEEEEPDCDDLDLEDDMDEDFDASSDRRPLHDFTPLGLTLLEPRGDFIELELEFEASPKDILHLVVVRYRDPHGPRLEEWCVEAVLQDGDCAELMAEELEDGVRASACAVERASDAVVVRAEVVSLAVSAR
jgi:hypothetical protein